MKKYRSGENLSEAETKRALKQAGILLHSKDRMPESFLKAGRAYYHKLKKTDGKPLIRKNAAFVFVEEGKSRRGPGTRNGGSSSSGGGCKSDASAEDDFLSEIDAQKESQDKTKSDSKGEEVDESGKQAEVEKLQKEIQELKAAKKEEKAKQKAAKALRDKHIANAKAANEELRAKTGEVIFILSLFHTSCHLASLFFS